MALFRSSERRLAELFARLDYCNPFVPERIELECALLGERIETSAPVWSRRVELEEEPAHIARLAQIAAALVAGLRGRTPESEAEVELHEDLVLYHLYQRYRVDLFTVIRAALEGSSESGCQVLWKRFRHDYLDLLGAGRDRDQLEVAAAHVFGCFFQIRRAFHHIFRHLFGASMPAARLRAAVWESIFTHDMRRYRRSLFGRMGDITTLVTGPSGTGKELVARAVGLSRYIPFDPSTGRFAVDFAGSFLALNLSALSPTLIESELFGHRRGAFTGAVSDRAGWLEECDPLGTVFLDEIGELDLGLQVKLLRVVQARTFQRLGETRERRFAGKIIASTNRDLAAEMRAGAFRQDFYYRLCSDIVTTPSLAEQIEDEPSDLRNLVLFLARRAAGDEAEDLADEVVGWIDEHMPPDYPWEGNVRELEQCVRNVMIRKSYSPPRTARDVVAHPGDELAAALRSGELNAEELLRAYCTIVYARSGSYEGAARQLKLDRRTVKARIDGELLERLRSADRGD